jgi:23S rRNA-intervening sequence protein
MVAWQLAFELEEKVVALIAASPQAKRDVDFRIQLTEACKGVPSNIAEGYGRYRPADSARGALPDGDETLERLSTTSPQRPAFSSTPPPQKRVTLVPNVRAEPSV